MYVLDRLACTLPHSRTIVCICSFFSWWFFSTVWEIFTPWYGTRTSVLCYDVRAAGGSIRRGNETWLTEPSMLAQSRCSSQKHCRPPFWIRTEHVPSSLLRSNDISLICSLHSRVGNSFSAYFYQTVYIYIYIHIFIYIVTNKPPAGTQCLSPPLATLSLPPKSIRCVPRVKGHSTGRIDWMNRVIDPAEHHRDWMRDSFNPSYWMDDWEAVCLVRHKAFVGSTTKQELTADQSSRFSPHTYRQLYVSLKSHLVTVKNDRYLQQESMF